MSVRILVGLLIVCGGRTAAAERSIEVDTAGAPFEADDLVTAIRVRVAVNGAPVTVRVTAIARGVRVEARGRVRDIELSDRRGTAAARLVALAAADLLLDDPSPPVPEASAIRGPSARASTPKASIGVLGSVAAWEGSSLSNLTVDLALPRDRWLAAIDVGAGGLIDSSVQTTAAVVRASAGVRAGPVELRAGVTLAPMLVTSGEGDRTVLIGAGTSARVRMPFTDRMGGVVAVGADAFLTRTSYQWAGMTAMTTPRWAPWIAAGLEVRL